MASFLLVLLRGNKGIPLGLFSSLSESGLIPTLKFLNKLNKFYSRFSSLSESGFIPTFVAFVNERVNSYFVLISFREWLHSYDWYETVHIKDNKGGSHLFQRVASFLPHYGGHPCPPGVAGSHLFQRVASFLQQILFKEGQVILALFSSLSESGFIPTGLYFSQDTKEFLWFSSLSESGFIPTSVMGGLPQ